MVWFALTIPNTSHNIIPFPKMVAQGSEAHSCLNGSANPQLCPFSDLFQHASAEFNGHSWQREALELGGPG